MTATRAGLRIFGVIVAMCWGCSSGGSGGTTGGAGKTGSAGTTGGAGTTGTAGTSGGAGTTGAAGTGAAGTGAAGAGAAGTGVAGAGAAGTGAAGTGAAGTGAAGTTGAAGSSTDGGAGSSAAGAGGNKDAGSFTLTSSTLKTVDGGLVFPASASAPMNQSPALMWIGVPAGTLSFALSMYDATAQNTHFVLWDIAPAEVTTMMLPANLPRGAMPTVPAGATWKSAFGGTPGYEGPGGGGVNNYQLVLWALKVAKLDVGTMSLNQIHATLLPAQSLGSATILAKGTRNGL